MRPHDGRRPPATRPRPSRPSRGGGGTLSAGRCLARARDGIVGVRSAARRRRYVRPKLRLGGEETSRPTPVGLSPKTDDQRIPVDRDAAAWIPSITTDRLRPTMSRPDTIARLKAVPLFQNCSARQLRRIANLGRESTFEAGRSLCEEGKFSKEFFVILEGHAEVRRGGRKRGTLGRGTTSGRSRSCARR